MRQWVWSGNAAVEVLAFVQLPVGMAPGVDFAQGIDVDMSVDLRRFHPGVTEHFLHIPDVGSASVHVGGARVSPQMAGAGFVDAAALEEFFDPVPKVGWAEAGAVAAEEKRGLGGQVMEERSGPGEVALQPSGGAFSDRQHPAFSVFALPHDQRAGVGIVVPVVEIGHFRAPDAGGVEEFQNRAVAQAEGVGGVGDCEQKSDFVFVEGFWKRAGLFARQIEIGGWIGGNGPRAAEPSEKSAEATQPGDLSVDGEWLPAAARTAVKMEKSLIGLEVAADEG